MYKKPAGLFLFLITLAWFVYSLTRAIVSPLFPYLRGEFNLAHWQLGFLLSVFSIPYALMQLPSGILSDRFGRRNLIITGLFVAFLGNALTSVVRNYDELLIYRFLAGLGEGTLFAPSMAFLIEQFPERRRGRSISVYGVGMSVGSICAPLFAGLFFQSINWRIFFIIAATPMIFIAVALWKLVKEPEIPEQASSKSGFLKNLRQVFTKSVVILVGVYLINAWVGATMSFLPVYLVEQLGLNPSLANLIYTIIPVMGIFSMLLAGVVSDKFRRIPVMIVSAIIHIALITLIGLANDPLQASVIFVVYGMLGSVSGITLYAFFGDVTSPEVRGTAYGLLNFFGMLGGQSLAPITVGYLIDSIGYRTTLTLFPMLIGSWGIFLLFFMAKKRTY